MMEKPGQERQDLPIDPHASNNVHPGEGDKTVRQDVDNADVPKDAGPLYMHDESPLKSLKRAANEMTRSDKEDDQTQNH